MQTFTCQIKSQSYTNESTGTPFVLVDDHRVIIEYRIVHHQCYSSEKTRGEIAYYCHSFVEKHVEAHVLGILALSIHSEVVAVIDNKGRKSRKMQKPFFAEYPIIAIAATNAKVSGVNSHFRCIGIFLFQFVSGLYAPPLIAESTFMEMSPLSSLCKPLRSISPARVDERW